MKPLSNNCSTFLVLFFAVMTQQVFAQPGPADVPFPPTYNGGDTTFVKKQMVVRNSAGRVLEIADLKKGKKHGKQTLFHSDGTVKRTAYFKKGLLDGEVRHFQRNKSESHLIETFKAFPKNQQSLRHGVYRKYGHNGKLLEYYTYAHGQRNGKYQLFDHNEQLKEKGTFKDNLNIGQKLTYSRRGILAKDEQYAIIDYPNWETQAAKNNRNRREPPPKKIAALHGLCKYYNNNGVLIAENNFENGKKEGLSKTYSRNSGALLSEIEFKADKEHGSFIHYNENGDIMKQGIHFRALKIGDTVLRNVYDGTIQFYQNNGKLQRIENWKNYKKHGVQERYHQPSGRLSERIYFVEGLKSGASERFDQDGHLIYQTYFEIVEKDGKKIAQQTGTESHWKNGKITTKTEWKNGLKEGLTQTYYQNGQLERAMNFKAGKLDGLYQSYYKNGQLEFEGIKRIWGGTGNSEDVGWSTRYDESGNIERKYYTASSNKKIIEHQFTDGKRTHLSILDQLNISLSHTHQIREIQWQNYGRVIAFYFYNNNALRKINFSIDQYPYLMANFTDEGDIIQVMHHSRQAIDEERATKVALKIAAQYNPKWQEESLLSDELPNGKYQWDYADERPFFNIEFKEGLPHGKWISYNPILKDTLQYCEFDKGMLVGHYVNKNIDGFLTLRKTFHNNHKVHEEYRYGNGGQLIEATKHDSLGRRTFIAEYYANGQLKQWYVTSTQNSIHHYENGDTSSYKLLFTEKDSIHIDRQFYKGNQIRQDRYNNLTTGVGYVKTYFENGQIQTSHQMKNKKAEGVYRQFDKDGTPLRIGHFKNGQRHGKWVEYGEENKVTYFKNGKISLEETIEEMEVENVCQCFDTTMVASKLGFPGALYNLSDYKTVKAYIPKRIVPINDWYFDKLFYYGFQTSNARTSGWSNMKLVLFNEFSFHYPAKDVLKFELNPCKTQGYISRVEANFHYEYGNKTARGTFSTDRIAVTLASNPLMNASTKKAFTAYFNTKHLHLDPEGIQSITYAEDIDACYPEGLINDFMHIQIESASLAIKPNSQYRRTDVPVLDHETKRFYGLVVDAAALHFVVDGIEIKAQSEHLLAGSNFVAGKLLVEGNPNGETAFTLPSGKVIQLQKLVQHLEMKGFYRVKATIVEQELMIEFFIEK